MKIGMAGTGRLGLPCLLAMEHYGGHEVYGYDLSDKVNEIVKSRKLPYKEKGAQELLDKSNIQMVGSPSELVEKAEVIFVAVQTPHEPEFEGVTRIPDERKDFDYKYLKVALKDLAEAAAEQEKKTNIVIISTVLPGTVKTLFFTKEQRKWINLVYNPYFIAMGTTVDDFMNPEFILLGRNEDSDIEPVKNVYRAIFDKPPSFADELLGQIYNSVKSIADAHPRTNLLFKEMKIESAELTKVAYNTFIGMKIVFANTLMEICEARGGNVDEIIGALSTANNRLLSDKYMWAGMGDGGGCFPAGEIVITENGAVPIEKISAGDLVLTEDGSFQSVVRTWERDYEGDLVSVYTRGLPPVRMTADHPVKTTTDQRYFSKSHGRRMSRDRNAIANNLSEVSEVLASDLTKDNLLAWPTNIEEISNRIATPEYLELAGWYLSEGSCDLSSRRGRLRFDLHAREIKDAERIGKLLEYCAPVRVGGRGGNAKLTIGYKGENSLYVRYGSLGLSKQLTEDFGQGALNKRIPSWILWGDKEDIKLVLKGLIKGDGHRSDKGVTLSTISPQLAWGTFILFHRLDLCPTLREIQPRGIHKRAYEVTVGNKLKASELCRILGWEEYQTQRDIETYALKNNSLWRPVWKTVTQHFRGKVYNLWVENNHTFVVGCGAVSNCHPRDNIAMSWLASQSYDRLSYDIFEKLMLAREAQTDWIADKAAWISKTVRMQVVIMGLAYKPETNLTVGSPALLLDNLLKERGISAYLYDPHVNPESPAPDWPGVYVVATKHPEFATFDYPVGSIVIDPWGYVEDKEDVQIWRLGRH